VLKQSKPRIDDYIAVKMRYKLNGTYTNNISDLAFTVLSLYHVAEDYTKAKIRLFNKKNGIVYEVKGYKLSHKQSYTAS